jgi:hypothetical protein
MSASPVAKRCDLFRNVFESRSCSTGGFGDSRATCIDLAVAAAAKCDGRPGTLADGNNCYSIIILFIPRYEIGRLHSVVT